MDAHENVMSTTLTFLGNGRNGTRNMGDSVVFSTNIAQNISLQIKYILLHILCLLVYVQ